MATHTLCQGDLGALPHTADYAPGRGDDHLWIAATPLMRAYNAPTFVDSIQYAADEDRPAGDAAQQIALRYLLYVTLHEASLSHRWAIADREGRCYTQLTPDDMVARARQEGLDLSAGNRVEVAYGDETEIPGTTLMLPISSDSSSHIYFQALSHLALFAPGAQRMFLPVPENTPGRDP